MLWFQPGGPAPGQTLQQSAGRGFRIGPDRGTLGLLQGPNTWMTRMRGGRLPVGGWKLQISWDGMIDDGMLPAKTKLAMTIL